MIRSLALTSILIVASCVGPQVSDEFEEENLILPAGSVVPSLYDDAALAKQIDDNDGVGAHIPLYTAFADGRSARYWDLGPAPDHTAPVYVLHRREGETLVRLPHPPIFGHIPGDPGYSPFWAKFVVEVTAQYADQLIPSVAALNQAQDRGLVGSPKLMATNINCPIIAAGVTVDQDGEVPGHGEFFYSGRRGSYLDFGETELAADNVHVPVVDLFVLRREGGEPLSEPARGVDMDGDGDTVDSNNVFALPGDAPGWSPLCREVTVTVAVTTESIDTSGDEDIADVRDAAQLFLAAGTPTSRVIAVHPESRQFNCPQGGSN